jgi:serine/threonine protein kinase
MNRMQVSIAVALSQALEALHKTAVLHLGLNVHTVCLPNHTGTCVQLMGFRNARLGHSLSPDHPPYTIVKRSTVSPSTLIDLALLPPELSDRSFEEAGDNTVLVTTAADVYAFGVVMLHALLGYCPFQGLEFEDLRALQNSGHVEGFLHSAIHGDLLPENGDMLQDILQVLPLSLCSVMHLPCTFTYYYINVVVRAKLRAAPRQWLFCDINCMGRCRREIRHYIPTDLVSGDSPHARIRDCHQFQAYARRMHASLLFL